MTKPCCRRPDITQDVEEMAIQTTCHSCEWTKTEEIVWEARR